MNKHSATKRKKTPTKRRATKPSRGSAPRKASPRRTNARATARKPKPNGVVQITAVTVAQVTRVATPLLTHKFRVGQAVSYTSSPISRPGATGSYHVVRLLPSEGDDYQYRIKNPGEAFERVAKESQLELEGS
jgi:hypothetical protein